MHEARRNPRQRKPRGKKAHDKAIEAQRRYKDRHQLDAVLSALVSTFNYMIACQCTEVCILRWF